MTLRMIACVVACTVLAAPAAPAAAAADAAENIVFPDDAGVVDVTKAPYNAKGDGKADATAALQKALDDHPNSNRIIYLPAGTYLVSDTLHWPAGRHGGMAHKRVILQGRSAAATTIRLKDECAGFGSAKKPKAMVWTGRKPAQRFRNGIRSLTFHTGKGNPGAIGVQYIANNQGSMRRVRIVCGESGPIGLDLGYTNEQGPCLIQDVEVVGFDVGVSMKHAVDSITLERIKVHGQREVGVRNAGQCVSMSGLHSENSVPAVENKGAYSVMTLIDSQLAGEGAAAVVNSGELLMRNTAVSGYELAVKNEAGTKQDAPAGKVAEYTSHEVLTLFDSPKRSLNLVVEPTPHPKRHALSDWVSPTEFGGKADGSDATEAVQKAIDSGRKTLYFPYGQWRIDGTVLVRGKIERLTALEGVVAGSGRIKVVAGDAPVVSVERMNFLYRKISFEHAAKRTVIVSGITFGKGPLVYSGAGPLFLEDVCVHGFRMGKGQRVWARQLNCEAKTTKIVNDGGQLWILGLKTEQNGTLVETIGGGKTEIVGGFCYANTDVPKGMPMFINHESALSLTIGESNYRGNPFLTVVRETRGGKTKELTFGQGPVKRGRASAVALYTGYTK
jgi:hypothetical protein